MRSKNASLWVLYFCGFIDYAGIAIVYPIFAYLFFDPDLAFFSPEVSEVTKGVWLGVLIALYPIMQFFSAPLLGILSDMRGRKKLLIFSLVISALGYLSAIAGLIQQNVYWLVLYRMLVGMGAGNGSILGAMVADMSTQEDKSRHFGFLSMSYGAGFTLAPFLGGYLVQQGSYIYPFIVPLVLVLINILFVAIKISETHKINSPQKLSFLAAFDFINRARALKSLHVLFLSLFIYTLGWSFFTEFVPLFLLYQYGFDPTQTGVYYGYAGLFYALSAGFLVPPIVAKLKSEVALPLAQLLSGSAVALLLFILKPAALWFYTPLVNFFMAFVYPTTATVISNRAGEDHQGEAIGVYQSVSALGMALSPFISGALASAQPRWIVLLGGGLMCLGGSILLLFQTQSEGLAEDKISH
jgi:DHA1 family tetracycline resistance protein-like MFS transporter